MGNYATGGGDIKFSRNLTNDEVESIKKVLLENCFEFDFYHYEFHKITNDEPNHVDFWTTDKYYESEVYEVLNKIAETGAIEEGNLSYSGDDDAHWKFDWEDGQWIEKYGEIVYKEHDNPKMIKFVLNGCDIDFLAEAPADITLEQLLKQTDRIFPHWCKCGICSVDSKMSDYEETDPTEIIITYDDVKKASDEVSCNIRDN